MSSDRARPPLNAFGISFGLSGLAGTWSEAARSLASPPAVAEALWILALIVWLATVILYLNRVGSWRDVGADLRHPVLGPFAALVPIPPMLWGAHLAQAGVAPGTTLVWIGAAACALFGVWFIAQLLTVPRGFDKVHGGYFLPTVAAGFLTAQSLATIGQASLGLAVFGVGVVFWLLIGGAMLARLIAGPDLPGGLLPTLGIFSAPPAVAGNAWWVLTGGESGTVLTLLAGAMVAVVAPHAFLVPRYIRQPFVLGFWALTFTTAASATFTLRLLAPAGGWIAPVAAWAALLVATALIALIAVLTVRMWVRAAISRRAARSAVPVA